MSIKKHRACGYPHLGRGANVILYLKKTCGARKLATTTDPEAIKRNIGAGNMTIAEAAVPAGPQARKIRRNQLRGG